MLRQAQKFAGSLTTIILVCTFMLLGFAHKNLPTQMTPELADFVAAGGLLSDICGQDHLPEHGQSVDCEACRLADNLALLRDGKQVTPVESGRVQSWRFVAKRLSQSQGLDPACLTRAPPYV